MSALAITFEGNICRWKWGELEDRNRLQAKILADTIFLSMIPLFHEVIGWFERCSDNDAAEGAAVAYTVSVQNRCWFCADVHEAALYGLGMGSVGGAIRSCCFGSIADGKVRRAAMWAYAGVGPAEEEWVQAAEGAHFANRVANAMGWRRASRLTPRLIRAWSARRLAGARLERREGMAVSPAVLPGEVEWRIRTHVRAWNGEEPGPNRGWVENYLADLTKRERAAARLALLTAMAPHQVDGMVREAFADAYGDVREMETVIRWAAWLGCRRAMDVTLGRVVDAAA
jgi:AhpD family alkylhydroperoxidase